MPSYTLTLRSTTGTTPLTNTQVDNNWLFLQDLANQALNNSSSTDLAHTNTSNVFTSNSNNTFNGSTSFGATNPNSAVWRLYSKSIPSNPAMVCHAGSIGTGAKFSTALSCTLTNAGQANMPSEFIVFYSTPDDTITTNSTMKYLGGISTDGTNIRHSGPAVFNDGIDISGPKPVNVYNEDWQAGLGILDKSMTGYAASLYVACKNAGSCAWLHTAATKSQVLVLAATPNQGLEGMFINAFTWVHPVDGSTTVGDPVNAATTEFAVYNDGSVYGGSVYGLMADYAEFFEWKDLNPNNEDRVGYCVVLDAGMIRKYESTDDVLDILGVISGTGAVIGNAAELYWAERFLLDDFGRRLKDDVEMATWVDENGTTINTIVSNAQAEGVTIPTTATISTIKMDKVNPDWDLSVHSNYKSRSDRPEWGIVGLLGQVWIRKDQPIKPTWKQLGKSNASATLYMIK